MLGTVAYRSLRRRRRRRPLLASTTPRRTFAQSPAGAFTAITIDHYRRLNSIELSDLRRINLIAGCNNTGKTTLLEAIHLLAHQNHERALLDLIVNRRARLVGEPDVDWLVAQLPKQAKIRGCYGGRDATVAIEFSDALDPESENQAFHRGTMRIDATWHVHHQTAVVRFYADQDRTSRYEGIRWLCRSHFQSPFSSDAHASLMQCHRESIENGTKPRIIEFLRTHVEPGLRNIEIADEYQRFIVTHDRFPPMDLGSYGEGLRRIFSTSLLFAGARDGVVLIDEFENALHVGLLRRFSRFIQELAVEFNVQVFLTTHSKEAIDAFIFNDYRLDDIVGFGLTTADDGTIGVQRVDGARLKRLVEVVDFDLRGL